MTTEQEAYDDGTKANECGYYKHNNPFLDLNRPARSPKRGAEEASRLDHLALHWDRGWDAAQEAREEWEADNHARSRAWA